MGILGLCYSNGMHNHASFEEENDISSVAMAWTNVFQ